MFIKRGQRSLLEKYSTGLDERNINREATVDDSVMIFQNWVEQSEYRLPGVREGLDTR
jgi:hypothetical protein